MMEQLTDDEIRLTKWFDGELSSDEISDLLAENPELFDQRMEIEEIGEMIRLHAQPSTESCEPPFPELFKRQILRKISETPATRIHAWMEIARDWFTNSQWAVPATAVLALSGILLSGTRLVNPGPAHSEVLHTFAPHPEHKASAHYLPLADATVIRLEGLQEVAPSKQIIGYLRSPGHPTDRVASTVSYPLHGQPQAKTGSPARSVARIQLASSTTR
jgi:hypothetical protein